MTQNRGMAPVEVCLLDVFPRLAGELPPDDPDGVCVLPEEDGADGFAAEAAAAPGGGSGFATVTDTGALIAVLNCLD